MDNGEQRHWGKTFVAADIPGLVEGASKGRGLGHDFLKHLERTKVIAYVIDGFDLSAPACEEAYFMLQKELAGYSQALVAKRHCVVVTKSDLYGNDDESSSLEEKINKIKSLNKDVFVVSAVSSEGITAMVRGIYQLIAEENERVTAETVTIKTPSREDEYEFVVRDHEIASLI